MASPVEKPGLSTDEARPAWLPETSVFFVERRSMPTFAVRRLSILPRDNNLTQRSLAVAIREWHRS